jgi:hypothetical protein
VNFAAIAVVIVIVSALGALFFIKRNSSEQPKQVKAIFFGLYFWGLVFLQLVVFGLGYHLLNK